MKQQVVLGILLVGAACAQAITPIYFWELEFSRNNLSAQPSSTDLVNGFARTEIPGILSNQVINESAFNGNFGVIDDLNQVYSWHMDSAGCLGIHIGEHSDGFLNVSTGNEAKFVNGAFDGNLDGILRDYGRAALAVRFGFQSPTNIGYLRVIGGNILNRDGRTFHHYDVWASTDGFGDFGNFFLVAQGVKSGDFGMVNSDLWEAALTTVHDFDSKYLVENCTDLRLVFYCVDNTAGRFQDPWQGLANEDPDYLAACPDTAEPEDVDGLRKAFVGSIIREVDVFPVSPVGGPGDTPWGDIDYDNDRDLEDAAALQICASSATNTGGCFRYDFDSNGVVAAADASVFGSLMTGPQ